MTDTIFSEKPPAETESSDKKAGPLGRGKSAIMSLLKMIEGSRERDAKTWIRIFETVCEFRYAEETGLEEKELVVLDVILHSLLPKLPVHHRRKFAESVSRRETVSEILTESLITDKLTVAAPILARSKFISDGHFQAAITRGSTQHRAIIAGRKELPMTAVDALLENGDCDALEVLLQNTDVILNEKSFLRLLSHYLGDEVRERQILQGPHLTMALAYQSFWRWRPASRAEILKRYPMTTEAFGQVLDNFTRLRGEGNIGGESLDAAIALHDRLTSVCNEGYTLILDQSNINELVEFMLNGLCMGERSVKRILTDASGLSLAVFCNALGLRASQFEEGFAQLFQSELDWETYSHALDLARESFRDIDAVQAGNIVTVWCFGDVRNAAKKRSVKAA